MQNCNGFDRILTNVLKFNLKKVQTYLIGLLNQKLFSDHINAFIEQPTL